MPHAHASLESLVQCILGHLSPLMYRTVYVLVTQTHSSYTQPIFTRVSKRTHFSERCIWRVCARTRSSTIHGHSGVQFMAPGV